ncbi:F-box/kelch-repeat protein At3g06240-like [Nicotiana tomentosiformis]|uniref:F-box/kelch-repeat protein At3g06240-like n=1 Tax=Nicotiana tomentosiformis TaxID=4098 RepID=UPI00051AAF60|nr:F-box/kelch-repeat protein At3g06240-like [Nicotiana tomentosiformis]
MLGFGFDSVTNDYKVVRIAHTCHNIKLGSPNVELYKLSTGVWEDITLVAPFYDILPRVPARVYVNGACHWVASKGKGAHKSGGKCKHVIVLFDMYDEMFREIMLPASLVEKPWFYDFEFALFESQESFCLAHGLVDGETTIDIWIMKGNGDPKSYSWVKQFSICRGIKFSVVADEFFSMLYGDSVPDEHQVTHYLFQPMASRKNGEILWTAYHPFLVSYDLEVKKMNCLCIYSTDCEPFDNALYVNTYKESLVLLDKRTDYYGGDACEESSELRKKELKGGRKKLLKGKTKRRLQIASSFHRLMYMSRMKAKRPSKIKQKKRQVKRPS